MSQLLVDVTTTNFPQCPSPFLQDYRDSLILYKTYLFDPNKSELLNTEWEKVTTTNFTTSKTKKNIKKFGDDHNIEKLY
jgi:hypothetical protein